MLLSLIVFVLRETVTVDELNVLFLVVVCADSIYLCVWYFTIYDILYCVFFKYYRLELLYTWQLYTYHCGSSFKL